MQIRDRLGLRKWCELYAGEMAQEETPSREGVSLVIDSSATPFSSIPPAEFKLIMIN
jgi:hypothetical protein